MIKKIINGNIKSLRLFAACAVAAGAMLSGCGNGSKTDPKADLILQDAVLEAAAPVPDAPESGVHPLSIPGLREREYGTEGLTLLDAVPAQEGLFAREFSYESDGHRIYGLIEGPEGTPPEEGWPVIVLAHGHIPPERYSTTENYRMVSRYYARGGFLVVKPDYRGHGRSDGWSELTATWIMDYTVDVLNLLASLDGIPDADTDRVFLYGHSMGGEIALRILAADITEVKGAALWAAMSEDFPENTLYYVRRNPDALEEYLARIEAEFTPEQYGSLSTSRYVDMIRVPLIIHHGTADEAVPIEWTYSLLEDLDAAGVEYVYHEYPGEDHNISQSFYRVMDADMSLFRSLM